MKKLLILLIALLALAGTADAQYIINNIGYTPYQQPRITSEQVDSTITSTTAAAFGVLAGTTTAR